MSKELTLNEVINTHTPIKDVDGWVLPFQGGRFRVTEDYDILDTGIQDRYVSHYNGIMNYTPNETQIAPRRLYERNHSVALKDLVYTIPALSSTPVNLVYLLGLIHKPISAPDNVLNTPNFKFKWKSMENINQGIFDKNDFEWICDDKVQFVAYNGKTYRLAPTPLKVMFDEITGNLHSVDNGMLINEGTNRTTLYLDAIDGRKAVVPRGNLVAYSLGLSSVDTTDVFGFIDNDNTSIESYNLYKNVREISDSSGSVEDTDYDFVYHGSDPAPSVPSGRPSADFSFAADELEVTFTDASSDDVAVTAWAWDFGDGNSSADQNPVHTYSNDGLYRVSLRASDGTLTSYNKTKDVSVRANQKPSASFIYNKDYLKVTFSNTSTDRDGTIASFAWDFGDGNSSTAADPVHTYVANGAFIVTLTATDNKGAVSAVYKQSISVVDNVAPTAGFTFESKYLETTFTDTSTDPENSVTEWLWDFDDGGNTSTAQNPVYTFSGGGSYDVSLTVKDADGKSSVPFIFAVGVVDNVAPTASFSETHNNLEFTFTDTSTDPENSVIEWAWDFGDGNNSTDQNPTHTYAAAGNYDVKLTVKDADGKASAEVTNVANAIANVPPTANFTYAGDHLTITFTDTSTDSDGTVTTWAWDFGDGTTSDVQNPVHTFLGAGNHDVKLTVTDDDNVASTEVTKTLTLVANVKPTAAFTEVITYLSVAFTDASVDGDGTVTNWGWDFGDGSTSTDQNPTHVYTSAGDYTVSLVVKDNDDSTSTLITKDITVAPNVIPTSDFTFVVDKLKVTFTSAAADTDGSILSYSWDFGDGNTSTDQNPVHTYTTAGDYDVIFKATDNNMEESLPVTKTVTSVANVIPVASFTEAKDFLEVTFTDTSTDTDGTVDAWDWDFGDGNSSTAENPVHTYTGSGTYTVKLIVADSNAELSTEVSKLVEVIERPVANFTHVVDKLEVTFTDTSTDDGTVTGWLWDFGDGNTSTDQNPVHTYLSGAARDVTLTVTDNDSNASVPKVISVTSVANVIPVAGYSEVIAGLQVTFTDTSTDTDGTITDWAWDFDDGNSSNTQNPVHTFAVAGTYNVKLTVSDDDTAVSNVYAKDIVVS